MNTTSGFVRAALSAAQSGVRGIHKAPGGLETQVPLRSLWD